MKPLLAVMNPRRIARSIAAFEALAIDKVWMSFFTEAELVDVVPGIIAIAKKLGYAQLVMLSDDTVPTQASLDLVLKGLSLDMALGWRSCWTGYCNLDEKSVLVNLTDAPFKLNRPYGSDYAFVPRQTVESERNNAVDFDTYRFAYRSFFTGMCLTAMSLEMWERYPFQVVDNVDHTGFGSDWRLSKRLQRDRIPIWAPVGAFVEHIKKDWTAYRDESAEERKLLVGKEKACVRWDVREERR